MAEKITKMWLKQALAAAKVIAEKFSLTSVAENLQHTENELDAGMVRTARVSDFTSFNEAMNAFATDTYLSQTRNDEYEEEAKKIKYTIFSGKVGDKFSFPLKQSIDAAVKSWSNIKCVYSYTCQQGTCPNDEVFDYQEVDCGYGKCKQGLVSCAYGTHNNAKSIPKTCSSDSHYPGCNNYTYYITVSCQNIACKANGFVNCKPNQTLPEKTCSNKKIIPITRPCEFGTCPQGTVYDIRCDKTTEAEE